jgi:uncharacterized protein YcsI (UPF0317 family)
MAGYPQPVPRGRAALLASDADRDRAARALRRHYAAGRLEAEELERRLSVAVSARTHGDLAALFRDLPSSRGRRIARVNRALLRAHAGGYLVGNGVLIGIWELAGRGEFWPAWALVPTTGVLAWHAGATYVARRLAAERRASATSE